MDNDKEPGVSSGSAGLTVTVTKKTENTPVANAKVKIKSIDGVLMEGVTGADGVVPFNNIDPDDYEGTVEVDDVVVGNFIKEVNTGAAARLEVLCLFRFCFGMNKNPVSVRAGFFIVFV